MKINKGKRQNSEAYDEDVCADVIRGLHDQMIVDGRISATGVGCVCAFEEGSAKEWMLENEDGPEHFLVTRILIPGG